MKKILEYVLGTFCWLNAAICFASEKFEILPDLPDPLAAYAQPAEASSVSGNTGLASLVGNQSVGHEPGIISVVFSLFIVILLIYLTGILYAKLNKLNSNTLKKQQGMLAKSQASVVSTTALGNNKTLHVIELDGKRMLIGATSGAIQLIKDLGVVSEEGVEEEFSSIEIPTIKIPKIEIPKIEIPSIGFSKLATKIHKELGKKTDSEDVDLEVESETENDEQNQEEIIDTLFKDKMQEPETEPEPEPQEIVQNEHVVNPDEYTLYKKYLG